MKSVACIILALALTGCSNSMASYQLQSLVTKCAPSGGIHTVELIKWETPKATCMDGKLIRAIENDSLTQQ